MNAPWTNDRGWRALQGPGIRCALHADVGDKLAMIRCQLVVWRLGMRSIGQMVIERAEVFQFADRD